MNYHVSWGIDAINQLRHISQATRDQEGLANTVTRIGLELGMNPLNAGESRDEGKRILFKYPLIVWFRVNERTKTVAIVRVRSTRQ